MSPRKVEAVIKGIRRVYRNKQKVSIQYSFNCQKVTSVQIFCWQDSEKGTPEETLHRKRSNQLY